MTTQGHYQPNKHDKMRLSLEKRSGDYSSPQESPTVGMIENFHWANFIELKLLSNCFKQWKTLVNIEPTISAYSFMVELNH